MRIQVRDKIKPDKFIAYRALLLLRKRLLLPDMDDFSNELLMSRATLAIAIEGRLDAVVQLAFIPYACIEHAALYH